MDAQALDGRAKVGEAVDGLLLGPPVKPCPPVLDQLLDVGQVRAVVPPRARDLIGSAGAGEALVQVRKGCIRDVDCEGLHIHPDILL